MKISNTVMTDFELLDVVKHGFGLGSDAELSRFLGVNKATITKVRSRDRDLGLRQKVKVLDRMGFLGVYNWEERLSAEFLGNLIRRSNNDLRQRRVPGLDGARYRDDAELLILFKEHGVFKKDKELAHYLDLKETSTPSVKCGRSSLGLKPRLQIFEFFFPKDAEKLRKSLLENRKMGDAVVDWSERQR